MTISDAYRTTYDVSPAGVWSAPGRVNLIGEHTDYNDGFALPFAIAARTSVAAAVRTDGTLRMRSVQQPDGDMAVEIRDLRPGRPEGWSAYVAGVVWAARRDGLDVRGLDLLVDGRVPLGSGLSSSHALECAVAIALNDLFELGLDVAALAALSRTSENEFVGARTGMMDQLASLQCTQGHALFLDNRSLATEQVPLAPERDGLALVVLDTRVHHGHADGAYGDRRAACEKAAELLGVAALRDIDTDGLPDALAQLDGVLGRRVRHVVSEDERVLATVREVQEKRWPEVGRLMSRSHDSLRDDYEVSCDELDVAVDAAMAAGALGARMTGGGFGGSAIALLPADLVDDAAARAQAAFRERGWREPSVFAVTPSAGARRDG